MCCKNAKIRHHSSYEGASEQEGIDDFVLFEKTSWRVDEQALQEVVLDVDQTLVQLLWLVGDVDRTKKDRNISIFGEIIFANVYLSKIQMLPMWPKDYGNKCTFRSRCHSEILA